MQFQSCATISQQEYNSSGYNNKKNRKELPPELVNTKGREACSSLFAYRDDATLVSYCPKKGKIVVLLSCTHSQPEVDNTRPEKKPIMILDYNSSKGGVITADQMLRMYSVKRMTRRWPMAILYNNVDISALNAFIIWMAINPEWEINATHRRRIFPLQLGKELVGQAEPTEVEPRAQGTTDEPAKKRQRCSFCPRDKDKKSGVMCSHCKRTVCKEHCKTVCIHY